MEVLEDNHEEEAEHKEPIAFVGIVAFFFGDCDELALIVLLTLSVSGGCDILALVVFSELAVTLSVSGGCDGLALVVFSELSVTLSVCSGCDELALGFLKGAGDVESILFAFRIDH